MKGKKKKHGMALFMAELLIIVVVGLGIFIYAKINENLRARNNASENQTNSAVENDANANGDAAAENSGIDDNSKMSGYTNLVLVGIDTREGDLHYANSDTMIICSINNDTMVTKDS